MCIYMCIYICMCIYTYICVSICICVYNMDLDFIFLVSQYPVNIFLLFLEAT